jgi:hypothetical protein
MTKSPLESRRDQLRANLLFVYRQAMPIEREQGANWYREAQSIMRQWAEEYGVSVETASCVTAALSPQISWPVNLIVANDLLAGRSPSVGGCLFANIRKAIHLRDTLGQSHYPVGLAMRTAYPYGPKVNAFARNLSGDMDAVTIDGHTVQAALLDPTWTKAIHQTRYAIISDVYSQLAHELGLTPAVFQATIWLVWKRLIPSADKRALTKRRHHA